MLSQLDTKVRQELLQKNGFCVSIAGSRATAMHGHDFLEFSYIEEGCIRHTFGGEEEILTKGDYFIVDYGTTHSYRAADDKPLQVINLLFYPDFVDRTLRRGDSFEKVVNSYLVRFRYQALNRSPAGIAFHDGDGAIYDIVRRILEEYESKDAGYLEYVRCLIVEMFILIMRGIGRKEHADAESAVISDIVRYIKDHYAEHLLLSDFAKKYSYSLPHLSRKFGEETGSTFMVYLQRVRMERACRLLEGREHAVSAVAEAVGYSDVKFFNKVFKETLGLTPTEFRKIQRI